MIRSPSGGGGGSWPKFARGCAQEKIFHPIPEFLPSNDTRFRGDASPEKVGWKKDGIDGQKVYLTVFMSVSLGNEYWPEESGVDMSSKTQKLD